jgi:hypothetical protein
MPKNPEPKAPAALIVDLPDGTKKIDFSDRPLSIDGVEIKSLVMREPTVDDQLSQEHIKLPGQQEVTIIANLCEQDPAAIRALKIKQYGRLQDAYRDFMS